MSDLISRQALLNKFNESKEIFDCATDDDIVITIRKDELSMCIAEVVNAPTVEERNHGHWKRRNMDIAEHPLHCTQCGWSNYHIDRYVKSFKICPNCGSIMEEVSENEYM